MITPGPGFVEEVFRTVQRTNTSQMSDKAEKDEEAVRMYRRSCEAKSGAERRASKLTELHTALALLPAMAEIS